MKFFDKWLPIIIPIIILIVGYALSWIITCGLIKLITMCFGLPFSWLISTGIYLILCILKSTFGSK